MNKEEMKIGFGLARIKTEQFATIETSYQDGKPANFSVSVNIKADTKAHIIAVLMKIVFEQEKIPFLIVEACCDFLIVEEDWEKLINPEGTSVEFPQGFIAHLAMLTVGTLRGILHTKTENTKFNKFLLPTINVTEMIKENVSFQLIVNEKQAE